MDLLSDSKNEELWLNTVLDYSIKNAVHFQRQIDIVYLF